MKSKKAKNTKCSCDFQNSSISRALLCSNIGCAKWKQQHIAHRMAEWLWVKLREHHGPGTNTYCCTGVNSSFRLWVQLIMHQRRSDVLQTSHKLLLKTCPPYFPKAHNPLYEPPSCVFFPFGCPLCALFIFPICMHLFSLHCIAVTIYHCSTCHELCLAALSSLEAPFVSWLPWKS